MFSCEIKYAEKNKIGGTSILSSKSNLLPNLDQHGRFGDQVEENLIGDLVLNFPQNTISNAKRFL